MNEFGGTINTVVNGADTIMFHRSFHLFACLKNKMNVFEGFITYLWVLRFATTVIKSC